MFSFAAQRVHAALYARVEKKVKTSKNKTTFSFLRSAAPPHLLSDKVKKKCKKESNRNARQLRR